MLSETAVAEREVRPAVSFWNGSGLRSDFLGIVPHDLQPPLERFNDWEGRGYDDFVPGEVTKIAPSGDETT